MKRGILLTVCVCGTAALMAGGLATSSPVANAESSADKGRCVPCDPKSDPSCERSIEGSLMPVADPISTPGAAAMAVVPCDPKSDPGCERSIEGSV